MGLRKKYQRHLNKEVRRMNNYIKEDEVWRGRFVMYQKQAIFQCFDDGSGGILYVMMRIFDKKNGYYKDYIMDSAPYLNDEWHIWEAMNKFITEDDNISIKEARDDKENFGEIQNLDKAMRMPVNYFLTREYAEFNIYE